MKLVPWNIRAAETCGMRHMRLRDLGNGAVELRGLRYDGDDGSLETAGSDLLSSSYDSDAHDVSRRAVLRLGKRSLMRLGKRGIMRLGKRAPMRLG
uniref:Uncharacterized protein n=1 Tax=Ascaris lumbricoides TaxID=6252 RepID=A0A0M3HUU7_ASCLU